MCPSVSRLSVALPEESKGPQGIHVLLTEQQAGVMRESEMSQIRNLSDISGEAAPLKSGAFREMGSFVLALVSHCPLGDLLPFVEPSAHFLCEGPYDLVIGVGVTPPKTMVPLRGCN